MKKIPLVRYKPRKKVYTITTNADADAKYGMERAANLMASLQRIRTTVQTPDSLAIGTHDEVHK